MFSLPLQVCDDGPGLNCSDEEVDSLFAPFYSTAYLDASEDSKVHRQLDARRRAVALKMRQG